MSIALGRRCRASQGFGEEGELHGRRTGGPGSEGSRIMFEHVAPSTANPGGARALRVGPG